MTERILRKLDSTTLKFFKLPEGWMEVFGNGVGNESDPKVKLRPDEVFEVRSQDGQLALAVRDRGSAVAAPHLAVRQTHTYVTMEVSASTWEEIARKMREAGYDHVFDGDEIDMHGLAVVKESA